MVDKSINKEYQNVINMCKLIKPHAVTALIMENGVVLTQPVIEGIRNYMILDEPIYSQFNHLYINVSEASPYHSNFKKTLSDIDWESDNGETYMILKNRDMDPYKISVITDVEMLEDVINREYQNVPGWKENPSSILANDDGSMYTEISDEVLINLAMKRMSEIMVGDYRIMVSRPFLGDTKNTQWLGYRVISEDPGEKGKITLKFKQREKLGNIFTYASFLKIKREE